MANLGREHGKNDIMRAMSIWSRSREIKRGEVKCPFLISAYEKASGVAGASYRWQFGKKGEREGSSVARCGAADDLNCAASIQVTLSDKTGKETEKIETNCERCAFD